MDEIIPKYKTSVLQWLAKSKLFAAVKSPGKQERESQA